MSRGKLAEIFGGSGVSVEGVGEARDGASRSKAAGEESLRWCATVPICTNPFILLELVRFLCLGGGLLALAILLAELYFAHTFACAQGVSAVQLSLLFCGLALVAFVVLSVLFCGNRYHVRYRLGQSGLRIENVRGKDGRRGFFIHVVPRPLVDDLRVDRIVHRELAWNEADNVEDCARWGAIILRSGRRQVARLYTPDSGTQKDVLAFLRGRLGLRE